MRILVVEDDDVLRDGLVAGLGLDGFEVDAVASCADARAGIASGDHAAIVLDIGLPDGSGLDLLTEWRAEGITTPILLLTARNLVSDRIDGLDGGADDYLGKPFDLAELSARLRVLLRRSNGRAHSEIVVGALTIDEARREVRLDGQEIPSPAANMPFSTPSSRIRAISSHAPSSKIASMVGKRRSRATRSRSISTSSAPNSVAIGSRRFAARAIGSLVHELAACSPVRAGRGRHHARVVRRSRLDIAFHPRQSRKGAR
ncbi:response regulator [Novosphingobium panipatense]